MAQIAKLESEVAIKSPAERVYKAFCYQQNMIPKMCPEIVKDVQVVKGDWDSVGSLRKWTFAPPAGGNSSSEAALLLIEAVDDKNKTTVFKVIDGDLNKMYSFYKVTIQVTESLVKVTQEYQKASADPAPEPTKYSGFADALFKGIDAYLLKNA